MSLYRAVCANVLFPLHERLKGHPTVAVLRDLERTQWLQKPALDELRLNRLRDLLRHAATSVPYYRDLFARLAFDPERVESLADLGRLPVLTKDTIRTNFDRMCAAHAQGGPRYSTTGSTGDPLQFNIGTLRKAHDVAAKWRATRWWGVDIGDRELVAWSSPIELKAQDRARRLRDAILRSKLVAATALTPQKLDEFIEEIRAFRPTMLFGYPSALTLVAQHADSRGIRLNDLGIVVAFCTAERLCPHQRERISRTFGCRVADGYGGRDAGFLAHECPEGGMHITAEDVIIETVDEGGHPVPAGEAGDVVVTHLFSHDFPFIRYRNGDVAVLSDRSCACGRGLPLIQEIQGRTNDLLIGPDGARIHGIAFAALLRDMPGVEQFKIIQETLELTRLQLVVGAAFDRETSRQRIKEVFQHHLGRQTAVQIEEIDSIAPEPSGKYRYVVSRVAEARNAA